LSLSTVSPFPTISCKYIGRYFSTKGTSSSNLPARAEPPPPAPPNQEEEEAEEEEEEEDILF